MNKPPGATPPSAVPSAAVPPMPAPASTPASRLSQCLAAFFAAARWARTLMRRPRQGKYYLAGGVIAIALALIPIVLGLTFYQGAKRMAASYMAGYEGYPLSIEQEGGLSSADLAAGASLRDKLAATTNNPALKLEPIYEVQALIASDQLDKARPIRLRGLARPIRSELLSAITIATSDLAEPAPSMRIALVPRSLGYKLGDTIRIFTSYQRGSRVYMKRSSLSVGALYDTDLESSDSIFVSPPFAQKLSPQHLAIGIGLTGFDINESRRYAEALQPLIQTALPNAYLLAWQDKQNAITQRINNSSTLLSVLFGFVLIFAIAQMLSSLLFFRYSKKQDIAMLYTLGVAPGQMRLTLAMVAAAMALVGSIIGLMLSRIAIAILPQLLDSMQRSLFDGEAFYPLHFFAYPGEIYSLLIILPLCMAAIAACIRPIAQIKNTHRSTI